MYATDLGALGYIDDRSCGGESYADSSEDPSRHHERHGGVEEGQAEQQEGGQEGGVGQEQRHLAAQVRQGQVGEEAARAHRTKGWQ